MTYRTISKEKLSEIIKQHHMWLNDNSKGQRANLSYANLSYADLRSANLSYAILSYADLRSANLRSADLRYANLSYADLRYANLRSADLRYANLSYADLRSANLVIFQFNRHTAYFTFDGKLRIGCHNQPLDIWLKTYKEVGFNESYTKDEISAYGYFIKLCIKLQARKNKESK